MSDCREEGVLDLLVRDEDLNGGNEVSKRNAWIGLPLLVLLNVIKEDDKIVRPALVMDLALLGAATRHDVGVACVYVGVV